MKRIIIFLIIILLLLILTALTFDWGRRESRLPGDNFNILSDENIIENSSSTLHTDIVVNNITKNQKISSPIIIEGKAIGNWFFEASFPIKLVDIDGKVLASTIAKAEGDWMTTDFVNFTANLEYDKPTSTNYAQLILSKDNPSDNSDFDQSIYIPVMLK